MIPYIRKKADGTAGFEIEFRSEPDANTIVKAPIKPDGNYIIDLDIIVIKNMYIDLVDGLEKEVDLNNPPSEPIFKKAFVDPTLKLAKENKDASDLLIRKASILKRGQAITRIHANKSGIDTMTLPQLKSFIRDIVLVNFGE